MSIEGEILVRLRWDGRRVRQVRVQSTRPSLGARIAVGRQATEAAELLPTLFSICAHAQAAAASAALSAAGARLDDVAPREAAGCVPLEAAQDTFWRLLIDTPRALGLEPQTGAVGAARSLVGAAMSVLRTRDGTSRDVLARAAGAFAELAREHVYGRDPGEWLAHMDAPSFTDWCDSTPTLPARALATLAHRARTLGRSDTPLMPGLYEAGFASSVIPALRDDADFARAPVWGDRPVETGALSRMCEQPLVAALIERDGCSAATRIAARLVELAHLLEELRSAADASKWTRAWPLGAGVGLAAVQTARGLLLHHARLDGERVDDYRIVAPTDWNFHPEGALARGLLGTEADDEAALTAAAGLAVLALDPCVGFRVEVTHHA
jgi:hypothetical protein